MSDVELVWDAECRTTESPVWDAANRRILFVDTRGGKVLSYGVDDGARQVWQLPDRVYSFGLCTSGRIVIALPRRMVFFDLETGAVEDFSDEIQEPEVNRFNDGRPGPDGAYWIGTMDGREGSISDPNGSLYRITADGRVEKKAEGFKVSNGIAFSPDGGTVYLSDTSAYAIEAWDFDVATGAVSNQRRFQTLTESDGRPDGAAVDAEGGYWSAGVAAARLNRYSPSGELLQSIAMPCAAPTMPCFAESFMYVTSGTRTAEDLGGREDLLKLPHNVAGLFKLPSPVTGADVAIFNDR